jgi:hypothetical protein
MSIFQMRGEARGREAGGGIDSFSGGWAGVGLESWGVLKIDRSSNPILLPCAVFGSKIVGRKLRDQLVDRHGRVTASKRRVIRMLTIVLT